MLTLSSLAGVPRWVAWALRAKAGKPPTKVPYGDRGFGADTSDPATWLTLAAAEILRKARAYDGKGIVLGDLGDVLVGYYLAGLDLDSCFGPDGELLPWAIALLNLIDTYAETSPSGGGIKLYFLIASTEVRLVLDLIGVRDGEWGRKVSMGGNGANHGPAIEFYASHRYFCVTEQIWKDRPSEIKVVDLDTLKQLSQFFPKRVVTNGAPAELPMDAGADEKLWRPKLMAAILKHRKLAQRYGGYVDDLDDKSPSAMDMSLGALLKWYGFSYGEMRAILLDWDKAAARKGSGDRYWERIWQRSGVAVDDVPLARSPGLPRSEAVSAVQGGLLAALPSGDAGAPDGPVGAQDGQDADDSVPGLRDDGGGGDASSGLPPPVARDVPVQEVPREAPPPVGPPIQPPDGGGIPPAGGGQPQQPQAPGNRGPRPRPSLSMMVTAILADRTWMDALRNNQFTNTTEINIGLPMCDPVPWHEMTDAVVLEATAWWQNHGYTKLSKDTIADALVLVANRTPYHPVREYLDALVWDSVPRVLDFFRVYFSAEVPIIGAGQDITEFQTIYDAHNAYLENISQGFMVGAVARIYEPGCKHDHVPIAVSRNQGLFKSTALAALCKDPRWFTDNISPNLTERDTKESLSGKWIIELGEIPHVRREIEKVKAFFSTLVDRYRVPYGRRTQDFPRQCVFFGTSNLLEFADPTGNRRLWPFRVVDAINVDKIRQDRDQLWAEAVHLYRNGAQWWLPPKIEQIAAAKQEEFAEEDILAVPIQTWLENTGKTDFTIDELFQGINPNRAPVETSRADQMRAATVLIRLEYTKRQRRFNGHKATWWSKLKKP